MSLLQRFEMKYLPEPNSGCWLWTGATTASGYGRIGVDIGRIHQYRSSRAHRVAYELFVGLIPEGMSVLHKCDTPSCVNPRHLYLGSQQENIVDAKNKHRNAYGSRSGRAKLNEPDIPLIRRALNMGRPMRLVAIDYGVSTRTVRSIADGDTWKHVQ